MEEVQSFDQTLREKKKKQNKLSLDLIPTALYRTELYHSF